MIPIKGYHQTNFAELHKILNSAFKKSGKTHVEVAAEIGAKTQQTVRNALVLVEETDQAVSDNVLCKVMKSLEVNGLIVYSNGEKHYYIR